MADPTDHLLSERGTVHGPWAVQSEITQLLKETMYRTNGWLGLARNQRDGLEMIATKIGRILAGNPNHKDHWDDIAGYARLVSRELSSSTLSASDRELGEDILHRHAVYQEALSKIRSAGA